MFTRSLGPVVLLAALLAACGGSSGSGNSTSTAEPGSHGAGARLEPAKGVYFGVGLDWGNDSAAAFNERLGQKAAVYLGFFHFPFRPVDITNLDGLIEQVSAAGGAAFITLEPHEGLGAITPAVADDLGARLAAINRGGVPVFVRFGHEMNGSWYPWSQQPAAYIQAFRTVADAVHRQAPAAAMVWAPNEGSGYPYTGGRYEAKPGTAAFTALDTDGSGTLTLADDMYAPFYPGDDAVDWVGMSVYHWGSVYPWGETEMPEPGKFAAKLTGTYNGMNGDETAIPDFYTVFAEGHRKPMAITETAALYNVDNSGGLAELALKQAWWRQVFDATTLARFPAIRMINWFEWRKHEVEVNGTIDWRLSGDPAVVAAFRADLPEDAFIFGPLAGSQPKKTASR